MVDIKPVLGKWVGDCCLMPNEQFFSGIMVRTFYISMRWWIYLFGTRTVPLVRFL
jgi:hypothetical protein